MNNGIHEGDLFTWTNGTGSAVVSGQVVVVGNILAVATVDIAAAGTGTVRTNYAFNVPKVSAAVIAQGEDVTWDASAAAFDDNAAVAATGDVTGPTAFALEAAGNGVLTIDIKLTGVPGTVA